MLIKHTVGDVKNMKTAADVQQIFNLQRNFFLDLTGLGCYFPAGSLGYKMSRGNALNGIHIHKVTLIRYVLKGTPLIEVNTRDILSVAAGYGVRAVRTGGTGRVLQYSLKLMSGEELFTLEVDNVVVDSAYFSNPPAVTFGRVLTTCLQQISTDRLRTQPDLLILALSIPYTPVTLDSTGLGSVKLGAFEYYKRREFLSSPDHVDMMRKQSIRNAQDVSELLSFSDKFYYPFHSDYKNIDSYGMWKGHWTGRKTLNFI